MSSMEKMLGMIQNEHQKVGITNRKLNGDLKQAQLTAEKYTALISAKDNRITALEKENEELLNAPLPSASYISMPPSADNSPPRSSPALSAYSPRASLRRHSGNKGPAEEAVSGAGGGGGDALPLSEYASEYVHVDYGDVPKPRSARNSGDDGGE
jgi:hypothetical protein